MGRKEKIKVDGKHAYVMGMALGMQLGVAELEGVDERVRAPGFQLALEVMKRLAAETRSDAISKNLAAVARAGHDIADHKGLTFDPDPMELVCEFYDTDLDQ